MIVLFGAPHGGMFYGFDNVAVYMEQGKKWPVDAPRTYEGQWIRDLLWQFDERLTERHPGERLHFLFMGVFETTPSQRALAVNRLVDAYDEPCFYIEPHINAESIKSGWGEAHGHRVFYNQRCGLPMAKELDAIVEQYKPTPTSDRRPRRAPWGFMKRIKCPAVLVENWFMTHEFETYACHEAVNMAAWVDVYERIAERIWGLK